MDRSCAVADGRSAWALKHHSFLVSVVDDDESVRESLPDLLRQFGFAAQAFSSAEAFLASEVVRRDPLSDPRHRDAWHVGPRSSAGADSPAAPDSDCLHHRAAATSRSVQRLLAQGAVECLFKPFSEAALLDALNAALRMR